MGNLKFCGMNWKTMNRWSPVPVSCVSVSCQRNGKIEERNNRFIIFLRDSMTPYKGLQGQTSWLPTPYPLWIEFTQQWFKRKGFGPWPEQLRTPRGGRLAAQVNPRGRDHRNLRDPNLVCTHCKIKGHEASGCFQLIGYPEWWGEKPKIKGRGTNNRGTNA